MTESPSSFTIAKGYVDKYLPVLPQSCTMVYLIINRWTYGASDDIRESISIKEIRDYAGLSISTVERAIKELLRNELIMIGKNKSGDYDAHYFTLNLDESGELKNIADLHLTRFSETLYLDESAPKIPPSAAPKPSPENNNPTNKLIPAQATAYYKNRYAKGYQKRSSEEHEVFQEVHDAFVSKYGKIEPGMEVKECVAIWGLIDKAKVRNPEHWSDFLKNVVVEFWRIKKSMRRQDSFIQKQPFLPSALNSSGIWPRVIEGLREEARVVFTEDDMRMEAVL